MAFMELTTVIDVDCMEEERQLQHDEPERPRSEEATPARTQPTASYSCASIIQGQFTPWRGGELAAEAGEGCSEDSTEMECYVEEAEQYDVSNNYTFTFTNIINKFPDPMTLSKQLP